MEMSSLHKVMMLYWLSWMTLLPFTSSAPVTVQMVRCRANSRYITWSGSTVASTSTALSADNFIVEHNGNDLFLRPYNDASKKLLRGAQSQCAQLLQTSSTGSVIYRVSADGSSGGTTGVKIYIEDDSTGEKYYLRVKSFTNAVSLECQSNLDNASSSEESEFEFDILAVSTSGL